MLLSCIFIVLYVFFFFKQKTAYEVRISDWSSDVCSSDLSSSRLMLSATEARNPSVHGRLRNPSTWRRQVVNPTSNSPPRSSKTQAIRRTGYSAARASAMALDRKSVVSGKSVSVRVDLGGRRILQQKKTKTRTTNRAL